MNELGIKYFIVHFSDWSQQPDVRIYCDQTYTVPSWSQPKISIKDVQLTNDCRLYTFDKQKVSCPECLKKIETTLKQQNQT